MRGEKEKKIMAAKIQKLLLIPLRRRLVPVGAGAAITVTVTVVVLKIIRFLFLFLFLLTSPPPFSPLSADGPGRSGHHGHSDSISAVQHKSVLSKGRK